MPNKGLFDSAYSKIVLCKLYFSICFIAFPNAPSIRIIDLVKALDKDIKHHIIGIRPGEKLHEVLCPADSSRDTLEFKDYYLIKPSPYNIDSTKDQRNDYKINKNNEKGKFVKSNFVYSSGANPHFLNIKEIKKLI